MVNFPGAHSSVSIFCDGESLPEYACTVKGRKADVYVPSVAGKVRHYAPSTRGWLTVHSFL